MSSENELKLPWTLQQLSGFRLFRVMDCNGSQLFQGDECIARLMMSAGSDSHATRAPDPVKAELAEALNWSMDLLTRVRFTQDKRVAIQGKRDEIEELLAKYDAELNEGKTE